jgi:glycosyltransferase involved in cell wall biosynthesis
VKPTLLFVTPVFPASTGNGPAMRCHAFLRVLAARHRVFLLVLNTAPRDGTADVRPLCEEIACVPAGLWKNPRGERLRRTLARLPALSGLCFREPREWARARAAVITYPFGVRAFDRVHAFRLYTVPALDALGAHASWRNADLDLDELESSTRRRLARLHTVAGDRAAAACHAIVARRYEALERAHLARFERLFVCSAPERDRVRDAGLHPAPEVAPNVVGLPADPETDPPRPRHEGPFRFLFVGTLGYAPNADAVRQFASEVLPRLRARGVAASFDVVGDGLARPLARELAECAGVRLRGFVPDLAPVYREADAVVVPLRAGGGTRIKVLEAFAHRRPVVATTTAIEGIDAAHERHVLLGELPDGFAAQCARLVEEPALGAALCRAALDLVRRYHSEPALRAVIEGGAAPVRRPG